MTIRLDTFSNSIPRVSPHLLPKEAAQIAENVDLTEGTLQAMPDTELVHTPAQSGELRTIYKLGDDWLAWANQVDVVKAQSDDITASGDGSVPTAGCTDRIFFTGDGYPKQTEATLASSGAESTYPSETRRLGVTPPAAALAVTILGSGDGSVGDTYSYYYTFVTSWGEESAPSPATGVDTLEGNQRIRLNGFSKPTLLDSGNDISHFRVYRAVSSIDGVAEYQLVPVRLSADSSSVVTDIPFSQSAVWDSNSGTDPTNLNSNLGEVCPTEDWTAPPEDLTGLIQFQNGVLAGYSENTIYLSEPYIPYAYPYEYTVEEDIVGIGVYKSYLIVATNSYPTVIEGSNPDNMAQTRLPYKYKCVSGRGLVSTPVGVIYPTTEGLLLLNGSDRSIITKAVWTKKQWNALGPSTLVGFYYEDKYIGFFQGSGSGFVLDINDISSCSTISLSNDIYGGYVDPSEGKLLLLTKDITYLVEEFEALENFGTSDLLTYTWRSKTFIFDREINYAVARLKGDFTNGSVLFKLYADDSLVHTETVSSDEPFWLGSGGYRASEWYCELIGTSEVRQVFIAQTRRMIARG
jgi:hypothetical protein